MVIQCYVPNCRIRASKNSGVSFHKLPRDSGQKEKWLKAIRREKNKENINLHNVLVCSKHFISSDFRYAGSSIRIKKNIVPTIFPWCGEGNKRTVETKVGDSKNELLKDHVEGKIADNGEVNVKSAFHTYVGENTSKKPDENIPKNISMQHMNQKNLEMKNNTPFGTYVDANKDIDVCSDINGNTMRSMTAENKFRDAEIYKTENERLQMDIQLLQVKYNELLQKVRNQESVVGALSIEKEKYTNIIQATNKELHIKQSEMNVLKHECDILQSQVDQLRSSGPVLTVNKFKNKDQKIFYYTGIATYQIFLIVYQFILPTGDASDIILYSRNKNNVNTHHARKLTGMDQFFMVLVKLRRGMEYETLADIFGLCRSSVATTFLSWINCMYLRLGALNIWPSRDVLIRNASEKFRMKNPNVIGSIDCTEFYVETPSSLVRQSQCYSNYKGATTLKGLIMIDPNGAIIFVSALFTGSISDKQIIKDSGFYELLKHKVENNEVREGDIILADKGFNIKALFEDINLQINIPVFKITGSQFTPDEVQETRKIAQERIHVERAINRIKKFHILSNKIPVSLFGTINQIHTVCCLLTNFRFPLIKEKK